MSMISMTDLETQKILTEHIAMLTDEEQLKVEECAAHSTIAALVDGRGLACPMPLLKTKVALRGLQAGESVYILATDPNSQHDLDAFCRQTGLQLILNTQSDPVAKHALEDKLEKLDTIFHLLITKTHGK